MDLLLSTTYYQNVSMVSEKSIKNAIEITRNVIKSVDNNIQLFP